MKKIFLYSALAATLAAGASSCSDFLEVDPVGAVSESTLTNKEGGD